MNLLSKYARALLGSAAVVTSFLGSATATAQTHYFSQSNILYSFNSSNPSALSSVEMKLNNVAPTGADGRIAGLAFDPAGTLWGSTGSGKFYTIDTTTGAITAKFSTTAGTALPTFDFRQNGSTLEILASQTSSGGVSNLRSFSAASTGTVPGTLLTSLIVGTAPSNNAGDVASGYDSATGQLYIVKGGAVTGSTGAFSLRSYNVASNSFSSLLSTGKEWSSAGGAWFGGQMYFAYRPGVDAGLGNWNLPTSGVTADDIVFGRLNTATGAFTQDVKFDLAPSSLATGPSFGYAVAPIPEPGSYALMLAGFAGLLGWAVRRGKRKAA